MITLITPTNNRPEAFALLETYIARQTVQPDQWLVVCDGGLERYRFNRGQTVIDRDPFGDRLPSLNHNLLEALPDISGDLIFIVEDDDFYAPSYLETLAAALAQVELVGVVPALYYHLPSSTWRELDNAKHASLAATGFTRAALPSFKAGCLQRSPFVDMWLWSHWHTLERASLLLPNRCLQVGLKGLPGPVGYGVGHSQLDHADPERRKLVEWIGEDAKRYEYIRA